MSNILYKNIITSIVIFLYYGNLGVGIMLETPDKLGVTGLLLLILFNAFKLLKVFILFLMIS